MNSFIFLVTGFEEGPGLTFDFALELLRQLKGQAAADEVAGQLLLG